MSIFLNKYFSYLIYFACLISSIYLLYAGRSYGLMGMPVEGTDQLGMLQAAVRITEGYWLAEGYKYSPIYTVFLSIIIFLSGGDLVIMRLMQAALCSLIPVLVYKLVIKMDYDRNTAQISSLIYLFYGPSLLISLDFLRAGPLALCFICFAYLFVLSLKSEKSVYCLWSGILGGFCILGRENFMPVIFVSAVLFILAKYKLQMISYRKKALIYVLGALIPVLPLCTYNLVEYGNPAILPGNFSNVMGFYHGSPGSEGLSVLIVKVMEKIPAQTYKFISSYELQNSLSFYAHRDIIDFLWIFIIPFNLLVLLSILAVVFNRNNYYALSIAVLCLLYACSMLFFEMFYRFRIPVVPLFAVLSGIGIKSLIEVKDKRIIFFALFGLTACFMMTYTSPDRLRTIDERRSVVNVLIANRCFYKAERHINSLVDDSIDAKAQIGMLINELRRDGQEDRAQVLMKKWSKKLNEK